MPDLGDGMERQAARYPAVLIALLVANVGQAYAGATSAVDVSSPSSISLDSPSATTPATAVGHSCALTTSDGAYGCRLSDFFESWAKASEAARASQPHWITPLMTVTARIEQNIRYDQYAEHLGNGADMNVFDGGKGIRLITSTTNEILISAAPYNERTNVSHPVSGWGDWPFLTVKQRLISANEENGNYIVSAFIGAQAPTGKVPFTNDAWVMTPTLAAGKGWGDFDVQGTVGTPIPLEHESLIGTSIVTNVAFQYHLSKYLWPEFEVNYTYWADGQRSGKNQVFLTPGVVLGRFEISKYKSLVVGVGYQFAISPKPTAQPVLTPVYDSNWIGSVRLSF
jgi:hypothetical protein